MIDRTYAAELAAAPARLAGHEADPRRCCDDCKRDLGLISPTTDEETKR